MLVPRIAITCAVLFFGLSVQATPTHRHVNESAIADRVLAERSICNGQKRYEFLRPAGSIPNGTDARKLVRQASFRLATAAELAEYTNHWRPDRDPSCLSTLNRDMIESYCPDDNLWHHKSYGVGVGFNINDLLLGVPLR